MCIESKKNMNKDEIRNKIKTNPLLKKWLDILIMNQRDARPRWYVRLLAPLYQHRGRGSKIFWKLDILLFY